MPGSSQANLTVSGGLDFTMGNYLDKNSRSLRPSYTHTAAPVLGPRAVTPGVAATTGPSVDVSLLLRALQRRRVESLVLGALSTSRQQYIVLLCWCLCRPSPYEW